MSWRHILRFAPGLFLAAINCMATDFYVATNGGAPNDGSKWSWACTNIQDALNAAQNGDKIYLAGHTFWLTNQLVWTANTNVTIRGGYAATNDADTPGTPDSQRWPTVITRAAAYSNRIMIVTNVATGTLERVTITGGCQTNAGAFGGGLHIAGSPGIIISSCVISNNRVGVGASGGGGMAAFSSTVTLSNSLVKGNSGTTYANGIYIESGATVTLLDSIVANNQAFCNYGGGICNYGSVILRNCLLVGNSTMGGNGDGIRSAGSGYKMANCTVAHNTGQGIFGGGTVSNSIVWGNGDDFSGAAPTLIASDVEDGDGNGVSGCISADPLFQGGYYLATNSPCVDTGTNTAGVWGLTNYTTRLDGSNDSGRVDMGYHYPTGYDQSVLDVYVATNGDNGYSGTNWAEAYRTITKALSVARDGTRLHVGAGSYTNGSETFPLTVANLVGVQILGASRTTTVINAAGSSNRVLTLTNAPGVTVSELTFTGGGPTGDCIGAGMALWYCAGATISGCVITNNMAIPAAANTPAYGGGIGLRFCVIAVNDVLLQGNTANAIGSGESYGGGLYMYCSVVALSNCVVKNNLVTSVSGISYGGGIGVDASKLSTATLRDSVVANNRTKGGYGGGIYNSSSACLLTNCLVTGNSTQGGSGDGFYGEASTFTLNNCTVAHNAGTGIARGNGILTNSIVWGNGDDLGASGWTASHTDIEDGDYNGINGCISSDPNFESGYYLASGSPCVDAGTNTASERGLTNYTTRTDGIKDSGLVDLGYHYQAGLDPNAITDLYVAPNGDNGYSGTNWAEAYRTIGKALSVAQEGTRIHVGAGSYTNGLEAFPLALTNLMGVQILGANRATTVIDATGSSNRVLALYNCPGVTLSELTFKGGCQTNSASPIGGGIALCSCAGAVLSGCVIGNNMLAPPTGNGYGGGLYASNGAVTLTDCHVKSNTITAVSYSSGGGIYTVLSPLTLHETIVARNQCLGGGTRYGGGVYIESGAGALRNCLVVENTAASLGGGIQPYAALTLDNCTLANNGSQGIRSSTTLTITNSIIWGHADDIWCGGTVNLGYSDIGNGDNVGNNGCISNNPLFMNTNAADYRLSAGSPCIDKGTNQAWMATACDLVGKKRLVGGLVDMGAYEYEPRIGTLITIQ